MRLSERGLDHGYVSRILSGERTPSLPYAQRLCHELGIFTSKGEPNILGLLSMIAARKTETVSRSRRKD